MNADAIDWPAPVDILNPDGAGPFVLLCEHASNHIPAPYARLGLEEADLERHIAFDPGAAALTRALSRALDAPAFLGTTSRLLVDLNRPFGVPSSWPVLSEATPIPGNVDLSDTEIERRRTAIFAPFHDAVTAHLDARDRDGRTTRLVTVHSFTPVFLGLSRPWQAGILSEASRDWAERLLADLARDPSLCLALDEPYTCERAEDWAIPVHGTDRGYPALLLEIRNDEIADADGVAAWATRLAESLTASAPA